MEIFIRIKAAGKRRDMLEKRPWTLPGGTDSAKKLIAALVRENVRDFNAKAVDAPFFHYLSRQELEDGRHTGKIGFGGKKTKSSRTKTKR